MKFLTTFYLLLIMAAFSCQQEPLDTCIITTTRTYQVMDIETVATQGYPNTNYKYIQHDNTMYMVFLINENERCDKVSQEDAMERIFLQNKRNEEMSSVTLEDKAYKAFPNKVILDENCDCN